MATVKVPGATIYYEEQGSGTPLVMIPGGPTDAGAFAGLASALADRYRTVAYDPRGNSRSRFDGDAVEQDLHVHAEDAARLIEALGAGPAVVLGSSGGAQIGLALAARHPTSVRTLVAHEPPCTQLLPEREALARAFTDIHALYQRDGIQPAMNEFAKLAGFERSAPPQGLPPAMMEMFQRIAGNLDYFLAHGALPIAMYRPDIAALRATRVVVGVGHDSSGQLANRCARALAAELGVEPLTFPGDHTGFGPHASRFADVLARAAS